MDSSADAPDLPSCPVCEDERQYVGWDGQAWTDPQALRRSFHARGGLSAIAISHPHYYTTMAEWSDAFGGVPIYLQPTKRMSPAVT